MLIAGNTLLAVPEGAANFTPGKNLAGEPRDHLDAVEPGGRSAPLPDAVDVHLVQRLGALFRAAQMAGGMEAARDIAERMRDTEDVLVPFQPIRTHQPHH